MRKRSGLAADRMYYTVESSEISRQNHSVNSYAEVLALQLGNKPVSQSPNAPQEISTALGLPISTILSRNGLVALEGNI
jgi:hypothetical protein